MQLRIATGPRCGEGRALGSHGAWRECGLKGVAGGKGHKPARRAFNSSSSSCFSDMRPLPLRPLPPSPLEPPADVEEDFTKCAKMSVCFIRYARRSLAPRFCFSCERGRDDRSASSQHACRRLWSAPPHQPSITQHLPRADPRPTTHRPSGVIRAQDTRTDHALRACSSLFSFSCSSLSALFLSRSRCAQLRVSGARAAAGAAAGSLASAD